MKRQLVATIIMSMFLAACASKTVKEEPAKVEDKSASSQSSTQSSSATTATDDSVNTSGVKTAALNENATSLDPRKDPKHILYTRSVFFDFNSDEVKAEYRPLVEAHAKYLMQNPNAKLVLQGNADDRGSREYNLALGQRRSVAVKKVMNLVGANDKQIETVSYGEEKQRCTDKTEACWAQNRRVDVVYEGE